MIYKVSWVSASVDREAGDLMTVMRQQAADTAADQVQSVHTSAVQSAAVNSWPPTVSAAAAAVVAEAVDGKSVMPGVGRW